MRTPPRCAPTKEPHPRDPSRRELNKTPRFQPHKRPLYTFRWILNVRLIIPYGYTQSINELMLEDIISICIKQQSSPCPGPWNGGVRATFIDILLDGFPTPVQTDDANQFNHHRINLVTCRRNGNYWPMVCNFRQHVYLWIHFLQIHTSMRQCDYDHESVETSSY